MNMYTKYEINAKNDEYVGGANNLPAARKKAVQILRDYPKYKEVYIQNPDKRYPEGKIYLNYKGQGIWIPRVPFL